jgi:Tetratricopeptide repeat
VKYLFAIPAFGVLLSAGGVRALVPQRGPPVRAEASAPDRREAQGPRPARQPTPPARPMTPSVSPKQSPGGGNGGGFGNPGPRLTPPAAPPKGGSPAAVPGPTPPAAPLPPKPGPQTAPPTSMPGPLATPPTPGQRSTALKSGPLAVPPKPGPQATDPKSRSSPAVLRPSLLPPKQPGPRPGSNPRVVTQPQVPSIHRGWLTGFWEPSGGWWDGDRRGPGPGWWGRGWWGRGPWSPEWVAGSGWAGDPLHVGPTAGWLALPAASVTFANPFVEPQPPANVNVEVCNYTQPLPIPDPAPPTAEPKAAAPRADPKAMAASETLFSARQAFRAGTYERALELADRVVRKMPGDPAGHEFRALVLFARGRYTATAAALYAVLDVGPGWNWETMSGLYADPAVYTDQLRALEAFTRDNPEDAAAQFVLAYHYMVVDAKEAAAAALKRVAELKPKDQMAPQLVRMLDGKAAAAPPAPGKPTDPAVPKKE